MARTIGSIAGLVAIVAGVISFHNSYVSSQTPPLNPYLSDYQSLSHLQTGMSNGVVADMFHRPLATELGEGSNKGRDAYYYSGHGFWVRIISHNNVVQEFLVTTCQADFHPMFTSPGGQFSATLGVSSSADVQASVHGLESDINLPASNGLSYEETATYVGKAGTFVHGWGWDSSCHSGFDVSPLDLPARGGFVCSETACREAEYNEGPLPTGIVDQWRKSTRLNTWEECIEKCRGFPGTQDLAGLTILGK